MPNSEVKFSFDTEFMYDVTDVETTVIRCKEPQEQDHVVKLNSSSSFKVKNIVDYKWEAKEYRGRLIACHIGNELIAYSIKVNSGAGSGAEGMIRVVNVENGQRCLIKGMNSEALDLEFAHVKHPVLLAYIEDTSLYVQEVQTTGDKLTSNVIFTLVDPMTEPFTNFKISWCPYVPESKLESDAYTGQLLVWSRGNVFQCYSINDLVFNIGAGPHKPEAITEYCRVFKDLHHSITDIVFSPDGSTLAVCTDEGLIKFFQIYLHSLENTPRQVHEWKPHNGAQVDRILFMDDLTETTSDDPLWQNVITCAHRNTEIKLWNCESWECLQTLRFDVEPGSDLKLSFKAALDETASYLVLSDMSNLELYVLQIEKARSAGENLPDDAGVKANIKSVAKFNLASPILSFQVTDAAVRRMKHQDDMNDSYHAEDFDDEDETNSSFCVVLQMYSVQPKSVQRCHLLYQPTLTKKVAAIELNGNEADDESAVIEPVKEAISTKSSPSREVENILSFNNNDDVFDPLLDEPAELDGPDDDLEKEDEEDEEKEIVVVATESDEGASAPWPPAPTVLPPLLDNFVPKDIAVADLLLTNIDDDVKVQPNVMDQLEIITKALQEQSFQMAELRGEMKQARQREIAQQNLLTTLLDVHTKTQEELNKLTSRRKEKDVDTIDHMMEKFTISSRNQIETIKDAFSKQIERQISSVLSTKLESIMDKQNSKTAQELMQQTQTNEILLKLNKNQMFNDALGRSISTQLKPIFETTLANCISVSLIPAYEKLTKELFGQVNKVFVTGIKEYTSMLDKHIHQLKNSEEQQQQILNITKLIPDQIQKRMDELKSSNAAQVSMVVNKDLRVIQANLSKAVRDQVKIELEKGFKEQASALENSMRSQTQTPVPSVQDIQQKIMQLLKQSRINEAFHTALIANDLSLVVFTLEKADFTKVFNPCSLEQTVLLSLIQQLSADMKSHNDAKQKYLSEAIMNLDFSNKVTKEHAPNILNDLRYRCREYVKENSTSTLNSAVRMLIVASQGVESSP